MCRIMVYGGYLTQQYHVRMSGLGPKTQMRWAASAILASKVAYAAPLIPLYVHRLPQTSKQPCANANLSVRAGLQGVPKYHMPFEWISAELTHRWRWRRGQVCWQMHFDPD
jgi:hypothetical protein